MFTCKSYLQMFIEFDRSKIYIDVHLVKFNKKNVIPIFKNYVEKYKDKKINQLYIRFWDTAIAGDYLSLYRKDSANIYLRQPLNGYKYIHAEYNYINTQKQIGNIATVN